jgi:uncharacterized membrane protein
MTRETDDHPHDGRQGDDARCDGDDARCDGDDARRDGDDARRDGDGRGERTTDHDGAAGSDGPGGQPRRTDDDRRTDHDGREIEDHDRRTDVDRWRADGGTDRAAGGSRLRGDAADGPDPATPDELNELVADFYRAEMDRVTTWRTRLDQTTNWAVVVMATVLTWAFSSPDNPHYVLLVGVLAVTAFLHIEARRYQEYDVWRDRLRTLQEDLYTGVFERGRADFWQDESDMSWRRSLAASLRDPSVSIPYRLALRHRLRRVYFYLLTILIVAWVVRITVFVPGTWSEEVAGVGVPAEVVVVGVALFYLATVALTAWPVRDAMLYESQE